MGRMDTACVPLPSLTQAHSDLPLCRASLSPQQPPQAGSPPRPPPHILLVDAYVLILVLYRTSAEDPTAAVPFPPPAGSALARTIAAIRHGRKICPKVRGALTSSE